MSKDKKLKKEGKDEAKDRDKGDKRSQSHRSTNSIDTPQRIGGKIQLGEVLGRGAFGRVFRGLNFQTGEVVAVKQITKELLTPSQMPSIMQELELLQKLSHPHIVKFISYHDEEEYLYFVMEYVESGSLNQTMKKFGVFPEELLVLYVAQVLQGLRYLHEQNVIHRDIKGCNLLLTKEGKVKLADFGSCTYAAMDKQFTVVGTPFWMAPEVIEMSGGAKTSDIWSVGCTLIELLTGKPPFWDLGTMGALFKMVDCDHPPFPDNISAQMKDFLLKCFVRDPEQRPGSTELLSHPWIVNNVKPEEEIKTPTMAEVNKTIREYNSVRRSAPSVTAIEWNAGQARDVIKNAGRNRSAIGVQKTPSHSDVHSNPNSNANANVNQALQKQVEELNERLRKATEENRELQVKVDRLTQENRTVEASADRLQKRIEEQEELIEDLQFRLHQSGTASGPLAVVTASSGGAGGVVSRGVAPRPGAGGPGGAPPPNNLAPPAAATAGGSSPQPKRPPGALGNSKPLPPPPSLAAGGHGPSIVTAVMGAAVVGTPTNGRPSPMADRPLERKNTPTSLQPLGTAALPPSNNNNPGALRPSPRSAPQAVQLSVNAAQEAPRKQSPRMLSSSEDLMGSGSSSTSAGVNSSLLATVPPVAGGKTDDKRRKRKVCAACTKVIARDGRLAMGKPWHHDCFRCAACAQVLDEFIEKDGKPYCVTDFNKLYGNRCGGCGELIQGQYIQAMNQCCTCQTMIQGGFIEKGNKPLCEGCFRAK